MEFSSVILAAGKGKRMNNPSLPKVLALLDGKPLLDYVLANVLKLLSEKIVIVVGHQKENVIQHINENYLSSFNNQFYSDLNNLDLNISDLNNSVLNISALKNNSKIVFVEQTEQFGTGHAVYQSVNEFKNYNKSLLILAGDVPLVRKITLQNFLDNHFKTSSDLSVLTALAANPTGYGRIIRDNRREFIKITEEKEANDNEKQIKEINSGIIAAKADLLFPILNNLKNDNSQGEYYLTDSIALFSEKGFKVSAFIGAVFDELQGVNSSEDLIKAEEFLRMQNKI